MSSNEEELNKKPVGERRLGGEGFKALGAILAAVITILFTWMWKQMEALDARKVDKSAIHNVWTEQQQLEYRRSEDIRYNSLTRRVERIEGHEDAEKKGCK